MASRSTTQPYAWQAVARDAEPAAEGWTNVDIDVAGGLPGTDTLVAPADFALGQDVLLGVPGGPYRRVRTDAAPAITAATAVVGVGAAVALTPDATGTNLVWSLSEAPDWLSVDWATGLIVGTAPSLPEVATFLVTAANAAGSAQFLGTITVQETSTGFVLVASNGDVVLANVDDGFESVTIEVLDATPEAFEGTYAVTSAALADGVELLAAPVVAGSGAIGEPLTGSAALWAYRPADYAAAGETLSPTRLWHLDGSPLPGAGGFSHTPTLPGSYTLVETVVAPDGAPRTATSDAVTVTGAIAITAEPMDNRWIDLAGILPTATRKVLVVMGLDDVSTDATDGSGEQTILTAMNTATNQSDLWPLYLGITPAGRPRGRFSADASGGGSFPTTPDTGTAVLDGTPRRAGLWLAGDLDKAMGSPVTVGAVTTLGRNDTNVASTNTATLDANLAALLKINWGRGSAVPNTRTLVPGAKLRWLWIATDFPNGTITETRDRIWGAFWAISGSAPSLTVGEKPLPADGTVILGGVPVTPVVFLAGPRFGQYDAGAGVKKLVNHGSGADPILNGDWFA